MKVHNLPVNPGDVYLIPGDVHFGVEDPAMLGLMTRAAIFANVNGMILVGDTFDSYGISRHPKSAKVLKNRKKVTVVEERESAEPWFTAWNEFTRPERRHVITGNHEAWWDYVQDAYPGLVGTDWWELYGDLFDGWHLHNHGTALRLGPLLVAHGDEIRGSLSQQSAATVLRNYPGQNTLYGHTHRIEVSTRPTWKYGVRVAHGAWTIGTMMDLDLAQDNRETRTFAQVHQNGFAIVSFEEVNGELAFAVEQVQILKDTTGSPYFVFRGKMFDIPHAERTM